MDYIAKGSLNNTRYEQHDRDAKQQAHRISSPPKSTKKRCAHNITEVKTLY